MLGTYVGHGQKLEHDCPSDKSFGHVCPTDKFVGIWLCPTEKSFGHVTVCYEQNFGHVIKFLDIKILCPV